MITWIQNLIYKHNKILFSLLLAVIIVSFVFYVGQGPKSYDHAAEARYFYGYNLDSRVEMEPVTEASNLSGLLNRRSFYSAEHRQYSVYERIVNLHLADKLSIPGPNDSEMIKYVESLPYFNDGEGKFDRKLYDAFMNAYLENQGMSRDRALEIISSDYRIDAVKKALDGPGYVLPTEAIESLREKQTTWSASVGELVYGEFEPEVDASDENLKAYYDENSFKYKVGEQHEISYVYFSNSMFEDKVTAPEDEEKLKTYYQRNRGKFTGKDDFEAAKEDVKRAYLENDMQELALKYANDKVVYTIYKEELAWNSAAFKALLKDLNVELTNVQPFSQKMQMANGRTVTDRYLDIATLRKAFDMPRYYSDPYPVRDGVAVMFKKGTLPEVVPALDLIKDRVTRDYTEAEKKKAFSTKGEEIYKQLAEKKAEEGFDFKTEAEALGLSVKQHFNFKSDNPPEDFNRSLMGDIEAMGADEISEMLVKGVNGYFIHLAGKTVPEVDQESDEFKENLESAMKYAANYGSQSALSELMELALDKLKSGTE